MEWEAPGPFLNPHIIQALHSVVGMVQSAARVALEAIVEPPDTTRLSLTLDPIIQGAKLHQFPLVLLLPLHLSVTAL